MRRFVLVLTLFLVLPACHHAIPPPTPVAQVADSATRVEQSANAILHAALDADKASLITDATLDDVAKAVYKVGVLGKVLRTALTDYAAIRNAGKDLTLVREAVQKAVSDIADAMTSIGNAVPKGTVAAIDTAVDTIASIVAEVRTGVGL